MELTELLQARENRWHARTRLSLSSQCAVVTLSMNIPGPDKCLPGVDRGFAALCRGLREMLHLSGAEIVGEELHTTSCDGPHWHAAVKLSAFELKKIAVRLEQEHPLGRLADVDVMDERGEPIGRAELGLPPRRCFLCDEAAALCRRRGTHTQDELMHYVWELLALAPACATSYDTMKAETVGRAAVQAAIHEAAATPKPGLVCVDCNGSHDDMDFGILVASAMSLGPYFTECYERGLAKCYQTEDILFAGLRELGLRAEQTMLAATGGVNTHKGLIFSLGLLCAALGRLCGLGREVTARSVCAAVVPMTQGMLARDFAAINDAADLYAQKGGYESQGQIVDFVARSVGRRLSAGEQLYLRYGITGARGEAEQGLPGVLLAVRVLYQKLASCSFNHAAVHTLLVLMREIEDTNVLWRGGKEGLMLMRNGAAHVLAHGGMTTCEGQDCVYTLCDTMVQERLSPGGCADMLAMAIFFKLLGISY